MLLLSRVPCAEDWPDFALEMEGEGGRALKLERTAADSAAVAEDNSGGGTTTADLLIVFSLGQHFTF